MNCIHCKAPIVLSPSAQERAKKYGGTPESYQKLFTEHPECALKRRQEDTIALLRKQRACPSCHHGKGFHCKLCWPGVEHAP